MTGDDRAWDEVLAGTETRRQRELKMLALRQELREAQAETARLRAVITRAKDALLDGQSTQWVHDVLVAALVSKP